MSDPKERRRAEPVPPERRAKGRRCPVCRRPAVPAHDPFCSGRCRQIDLGRWLKGAYHIPGRPPGVGEEDDG